MTTAKTSGDDGPRFDEIAETFELLDDWEARYGYVIELGGALPGLDESLKSVETKVDGCASQVWLSTSIEPGEDGILRLFFQGDSDAHIVRGLIAILQALLNGRPATEVASSDPISDLAKIGLESQLSSQRSNGLRAMIARLKQVAASVG